MKNCGSRFLSEKRISAFFPSLIESADFLLLGTRETEKLFPFPFSVYTVFEKRARIEINEDRKRKKGRKRARFGFRKEEKY